MGTATLQVMPEILGRVLGLLPPGVSVVGSRADSEGFVSLAVRSDHLADGDRVRLVVTTTPLSVNAELRKV